MAWSRSSRGVAVAIGLSGAALILVGLRSTRAQPQGPSPPHPPHAPAAAVDSPPLPAVPGEEIEVPPPPFSDGIFPCTQCHKKGPDYDSDRRELGDPHDKLKFDHDAENRWCLDCHSGDDRDHLRLASGKLIEFTESYKLCGQCHGDKYRDWRAGIHGRRTGQWDGHKKYLLCVSCHNPHSPHFRPLKPEPAPRRPEALR